MVDVWPFAPLTPLELVGWPIVGGVDELMLWI